MIILHPEKRIKFFEALKKRPQQFLMAYGLLDQAGQVVYDINPNEIGLFEGNSDFYSKAFQGTQFISNIEFSEQDGKPYLYFSAPVTSTDQGIVGILRAKREGDNCSVYLIENPHPGLTKII